MLLDLRTLLALMTLICIAQWSMRSRLFPMMANQCIENPLLWIVGLILDVLRSHSGITHLIQTTHLIHPSQSITSVKVLTKLVVGSTRSSQFLQPSLTHLPTSDVFRSD